jgi:hypothetical protein
MTYPDDMRAAAAHIREHPDGGFPEAVAISLDDMAGHLDATAPGAFVPGLGVCVHVTKVILRSRSILGAIFAAERAGVAPPAMDEDWAERQW